MTATRTVVTIDATAFAEFLEGLAVAAEGDAARFSRGYTGGLFFQGCSVAYRCALDTFTEQIEKGTAGFLVVER